MDARIGEILAAPSGGRVSVLVDGSTLSLRILRGYTPTVGDECLVLLRRSSGYVLGALGTAPPTPKEEARPAPSRLPQDEPDTGSSVFRPTSTGSYRSGSWRADTRDLYQGDYSGRGLNTGAAFYGKGPRGLRGVTVTRARVKLKRLPAGSYGTQTPTLRLFAETSRQGAPDEVLSTSGPGLRVGESTTFVLPTTWGQRMVDGTAGGLGIRVDTSSPYVRLDGSAMQLLIDWRK